MITITKNVFDKFMHTLGARMPETGGILAINQNGIIDEFVYDKGIKSSTNFYIPNTKYLNQAICKWDKSETRIFAGMAHSHEIGKEELSESDIEYAKKLIECFDLSYVYMLLLTTNTKQHKLLGYKCYYFENKKFIIDKHNIKII